MINNQLIKVCGMTEGENIRAIEALGVDLIGFIFYPGSPRYVRETPSYLPAKAGRVGVFVDAPREEILRRNLPEIAAVCRKAERIADAYPDSVGGATIRYALANAPLDKIYDTEKTTAELDAWLADTLKNG